MKDMKNEPWLMDKYNQVCQSRIPGYALVSLKIKRFRIFNRLYDRETGDLLIEKVYEVLEDWLEDGEYIARIYLDYYNILMRFPDDYDALFARVIEMNRIVRDMPYEPFQGKIFSGLGIFPLPEEPVDFYTAQYNADICRNECPQSPYRNSHFEVYGVTYRDNNLLAFDLAQNLLPAIEAGHIKLYLQPKVDLRTGEITRAEALVRWIDPEKGMIPVGDFLPSLEENGLIEEVDLYLFGKVCRLINQWKEKYGRKICISVNLSRCAFEYIYFFKDYQKVYAKDPCPKDCIEFELLESIVLNQVERVKRVVTEIKDFGFSCSLDDFGSGYSSFSVLTNVDLSTLKIDRSLFMNENDPREQIIIRNILKTAQALHMKSVAEGVETRGYVDFLRELGCDYVQGYVYYKPMPAEEFEERFLVNGEKVSFDES